MSRKHFVALAAALRESRPESNGEAREQWKTDVRAIASACAAANGSFDRCRFYAACCFETA